jgi:septum site-determining protein MinC
MNEAVTIKGSASGLLIRLRDEEEEFTFTDLLQTLSHRLLESEKFFQHARTTIDLGRRELTADDLETLTGLLARHEMQLAHIVSGANVTRSAARRVGIEYKLPNRENTRPPLMSDRESPGMPFDSAEALFVKRTLRSGQVIQHHAAVCLLGDVNHGAQIVAGGSVLVWGTVRGVIEAGSTQPDACVCALQLTPSLLRIGDTVAQAPEKTHRYSGPGMALVQKGVITIQPWSPRKS